MDKETKLKRWRDRSNEFLYVPEQYFSGNDISVFINDTEAIEVSSIAFELKEQLRPIYGYNSYTFDAMATGNRLIMGSLTIPFVKKNYLKDLVKPKESARSDFWEGDSLSHEQNQSLSLRTEKQVNEYIERRFGTESIELDIKKQREDRYYYPGMFGVEYNDKEREKLLKEGFNIYIAYGKQSVEEVARLYTRNVYSFENNLDVILERGVRVIKGVFIRGMGQAISVNNALYETYEFVAKDIF